MGKNLIAIALAVFTLGAAAPAQAGTEVIQDLNGPAPHYNNYAPAPPQRVYYPPPPPVRLVVYPSYGVYYGPRYGYYPHSRVFVRHGYRRHWR